MKKVWMGIQDGELWWISKELTPSEFAKDIGFVGKRREEWFEHLRDIGML